MLRAYHLATALIAPLWRRGLERRIPRGKEDPARWREKLGVAGQPRPEGKLAWFHALSVGEALALLSLFRELRRQVPGLQILLTSSTRTSVEALEKVGLPKGVRHQYAPIDTPGAVRGFLDHWRPDIAVFAELDLWPRLIGASHAREIPLLLINSRLSAARLAKRQRLARLYGPVLRRFDRILAQDAESVPRFAALGADPARIEIAGALKSAAEPLPDLPEARAALGRAIGTRPVWLAAATESREHELLIDAQAMAAQKLPGLLMILAPRHMRELEAAEQAAEARGLSLARRSRGEMPGESTDIYLADSFGEMGLWLRLAGAAFLGHSLPLPDGTRLTGKNPWEALALRVPLIHGPHTGNFADSYAAIRGAGAGREVAGPGALAEALVDILDGEAGAPLIAAGDRLVAEGRQPLERAARLIADRLNGTDG